MHENDHARSDAVMSTSVGAYAAPECTHRWDRERAVRHRKHRECRGGAGRPGFPTQKELSGTAPAAIALVLIGYWYSVRARDTRRRKPPGGENVRSVVILDRPRRLLTCFRVLFRTRPTTLVLFCDHGTHHLREDSGRGCGQARRAFRRKGLPHRSQSRTRSAAAGFPGDRPADHRPRGSGGRRLARLVSEDR